MAGRAVDMVVIAWVSLFVLVEIFGRLLGGDPLGRESSVDLSSTRILVGLAFVLVIYEILPVTLAGATLGKAMLGLRVIRLDTWDRPGPVDATLRALVLYGSLAIPYVGFIVFALVVAPVLIWPTRRGLHDVVAGTAVIRLDRGPGDQDP